MYPRVGVGVFVFNGDHQILIGLRKGSHGAGTYALPGGHLEFNESFAACAAREVLKETGLAVDHVRFLTATNDVMREENRHYVTIFVGARVKEGELTEPKVMEPEKCEGWEWIKWSDTENLAHNQLDVHEVDRDEPIDDGQKLFLPLVDLVKQRPRFNPENSWNDAEDLDE